MTSCCKLLASISIPTAYWALIVLAINVPFPAAVRQVFLQCRLTSKVWNTSYSASLGTLWATRTAASARQKQSQASVKTMHLLVLAGIMHGAIYIYHLWLEKHNREEIGKNMSDAARNYKVLHNSKDQTEIMSQLQVDFRIFGTPLAQID